MFNRAELKEEVKRDIRETRPRAILVTLVFLLLSGAVMVVVQLVQSTAVSSDLISRFTQLSQLAAMGLVDEETLVREFMAMGDEVAGAAGKGMVFSLLTSLVTWTLNFGYQGYCLGMVRRENPGYSRLFCALPQWGWVLLTGLLTALFTTLWSILFWLLALVVTVLLVILMGDANAALTATFATLAWIATLGGIIAVSLRYAMANYILLDEKTDALEAISRSKRMMRGRKFHLFVLYLSFIGWYLLIGLIAGVVTGIVTAVITGSGLAEDPMLLMGSLSLAFTIVLFLLTIPLQMWLSAYATGSEAKFYDWLRREDQAGGVWEGGTYSGGSGPYDGGHSPFQDGPDQPPTLPPEQGGPGHGQDGD